jgi:PAS domain S-box-containing protein
MKVDRADERRSSLADDDLVDLFEHAVVALHVVDAEGIIVKANQAELDLLGYTQEEYVGHHIREFHADPPVIDDILWRLGRNETLQNYEARLRCKDGRIKHVLISSNVRWAQGRFLHTRCFTRDITEQKLAEQERERLLAALQQTNRRLQDKVEELEKFHDVVVGRELKMIELEKEVAHLRQEVAALKGSQASGDRASRGRRLSKTVR